MQQPEFYSIPEYAALKQISRQAVYLLIKTKEIDSVKLYGKQLIKNNSKAVDYLPRPGKRSDLGTHKTSKNLR